MTWNDEIVDEVRRVRNEYAEKFNYDISAICADIRQKQAASKHKIVAVNEQEVKDENNETLQAA
jgi:hypothetical protein